jgi:hypothetical protein
MVHTFVIGLIQSANRAPAGILIQNLYFGCDTGDEDHVQKFRGSGFCSLVTGFWQPFQLFNWFEWFNLFN